MNKTTLTIIFALGALSLTACSTENQVRPFTPRAAEADQAVVYLYRPEEMANALYSPGINVNDEFRFYAKRGVSSRLALTPGEHRFDFQHEKKYTELTSLSLTLDAGVIYYLRINTSLKVNSATNYQPYERSFTLTQIAEPQALMEIAECCFDNGKKSVAATPADTTHEETGHGFSVDKTQNPFSH